MDKGAKYGFILRHGETDLNKKGLPRALSNIPLNRKGIAQAYAAGRLLKDKGVTLIRSSKLERTKHTAKIVGKSIGLKPEYTDALDTMDVGDWAKLPDELLDKKLLDAFLEHAETPVPGGQSPYEWLQQIWPELEYFFVQIDQGKHPLIVTHGRVTEIVHALIEGKCKVLAKEVMQAEDYLQKPGQVFAVVKDGENYRFQKV